MKKLISLLLAICVFPLALTLTACGEKHTHAYATEWSKDATHHWHECTGEDCIGIADKAEHTWDEGEVTTEATAEADGVKTFTCSVCEQTKTESVAYVVDYTVMEAEWRINFNLTKGQVQAQALLSAPQGLSKAQMLDGNSSQELTEITSYTVYAVGTNVGVPGTSLLKVAPDAMSIDFYVNGSRKESECGTFASSTDFYKGLTKSVMSYFPFADYYDDFTFDETKNAYVCQNLTSVLNDEYDVNDVSYVYTKSAEVTFVNGYLSTVTVDLCDENFNESYASFVFTFSDINATTVAA